MKRYWYVCERCGSKNVNCSGPVHWDFGKQQWVFDGIPFDDDYCGDCEDETNLVQIFE